MPLYRCEAFIRAVSPEAAESALWEAMTAHVPEGATECPEGCPYEAWRLVSEVAENEDGTLSDVGL